MSKISYIVPVQSDVSSPAEYDESVQHTLRSVVHQTVPFWDLTLCVQPRHAAAVRAMVSALRTPGLARKIHIIEVSSRNQAVGLNQALARVRGRWLAVVEPGDVLAQHATFTMLAAAGKHSKAQLIYADRDYLDPEGVRFGPYFRSDFSRDLLYSQNYIGNFFAIRTRSVKSLGGFDVRHGLAWSYDLILRLLESVSATPGIVRPARDRSRASATIASSAATTSIVHTPGVIYHQRVNSPYTGGCDPAVVRTGQMQARMDRQGLTALKAHFLRSGLKVSVAPAGPGVYRHRWPVPKPAPLVSIIIPTRDGLDILRACVMSIISKTTYRNYEILISDNQSREKRTLSYLRKLSSEYENIKVISFDQKFNYSAINNHAVKFARGSLLAFVNNDIEVISPDWLTEMVSHALRPDVGCVGALHCYPDGTIQHAGVIVGMNGVADHSFKCKDRANPASDYHGFLRSVRDTDAVTAATLVMRRDLFTQSGGFDARYLAIAFNDVDLCLRLKQSGYRVVWTPHAELLHHESKTRAADQSEAARQREIREHAVMKSRWKTHKVSKKGLLHSHAIGL